VCAGILLVAGGAVALDLTYPADCPTSAQECFDQICNTPEGGTLFVQPGTHQWGPSVRNNVQTQNNLFALFCDNLKIVGAGTDPVTGTTIDCSNSNVPALGGPPCTATGLSPFDALPNVQNVEVKGIRFVCPSSQSSCAGLALGAIGIDGFHAHKNKTEGFAVGLQVRSSNNVTIEKNEFIGRGLSLFSTGIQKAFAGFPAGAPANDPATNLNHDWLISKNTITDTTIGMDLIGITDSTISKNTQSGGRVGIRIRGGENNVYEKNTIMGISPAFLGTTVPAAGMSLRTEDSSVLSKNQICSTVLAPSLRFDATNPAFDLANWPSFTNGNSDLLLEKNEFLGYDPNVCGVASRTDIAIDGHCFDDSPFSGGVSDGGGNQFIKNESDSSGGCPMDL
jgi:parallel beta-helix repeat protein